jgi:hypothetical protein
MPLQTFIHGITGKSPFDVYICQGNGENCVYINTITQNQYAFTIPQPYDAGNTFLLKIIDANKSVITGYQEIS